MSLTYNQLLDLARRVYHLEHITCDSCLRYQLPPAFADQEYEFTDDIGRHYSWHVESTQALARRYPSEVQWGVPIPDDQLLRMMTICEVVPEHVQHLPTTWLTVPGVMVTVLAPDGSEQHILIDGSHRAHRAVQDRRAFYVTILNRQLSQHALEYTALVTQQKIAESRQNQGAIPELLAAARRMHLL